VEAAQSAVSSPLLDLSMHGARGVLFNITGSNDLKLTEINQAAEVIRSAADPDANIIFGAVIDEALSDEVKITVIATGFEPRGRPRAEGRAREGLPPPPGTDRSGLGSRGSLREEDLDLPPGLRNPPGSRSPQEGLPPPPDWMRG
jgi:cell division protein FtsZ